MISAVSLDASPQLFTAFLAAFSPNIPVTDSFNHLYFPAFHNLSNIFLPFMQSVLGTSIFFDEYKNDTLKELLMVPMSKAQIFLAKMTLLFLTSLLLMFLTAVFAAFGDLITGGFSNMTWQSIVRVVWLYAQGSLLIPTAMMPIVFLIVATRKSYIFSICSALFYIAPVSLLPASLMGIHPLASVQLIVGASSPEALDIVSDGMIETVRTMPFPPNVLYRAWTKQFDLWFAEPGSVLMKGEVNIVFYFETAYEGNRHPHYGRFLRLVPDQLVELTWLDLLANTPNYNLPIISRF